MARIITLSPDAGRIHRLDGAECLLGRRIDCHIHIDDQRVSRRHARVRREGDVWQLEDLGSCNGTFVNGRRIQGAARLRHGDELEIGASRFRMDLSDEMVAAAESAVLVPAQQEVTQSVIAVVDTKADRSTGRGRAIPEGEREREIERIQRKLQAMYSISETVANTIEPRALLDRVTALLLEVFPQASVAVAVTLDARQQQLRTQAARRRKGRDRDSVVPNMTIPEHVVDRVLRKGQSVLLRAHAEPDARTVSVDSGRASDPPEGDAGQAVGWSMGAPLAIRGEQLGILHVEADPVRGYFTQDDLDLLGGLASQAGMALHQVGLHQRLLERERLDYDLRLARQIQRNLLPRDPPRVVGFDFSVHYEPAFHVGGDFYDFLWLEPTKLALVVGDVSGKAISGALFMARVTSEIRAAAPVESSPRRVLQRVNRALSEVAEDGMFTTMVYVVIDLQQNVLRFANAGHTTPILRRGGEVIPLESPEARTLPLGIEVKIDVGEAQVQLQPGDTLMLYTDGLIEARSPRGEFYGQERLQHSVERASGLARSTLEAVLADLDRFVEEAPQADDQTVVCLSVNDAAPKRFQSIPPTVIPPAID